MPERNNRFIPDDSEYWSKWIVAHRILHVFSFGTTFAFIAYCISDSEWPVVLGAVVGALSAELVFNPLAWRLTKNRPVKK